MQASSGLEKHSRSALNWVSTTACCRFILLLGPAISCQGSPTISFATGVFVSH